MRLMGKRKLIFLSLFFAASFIFAQEHLTGKMLIMGWGFDENDTRAQTNTAIDAMIKYVEAAIYQMSYDESDEPSTLIELYKRTDARYTRNMEGVYIYFNIRSDEDSDEGDYLDRYVEINFYILSDERNNAQLYKLIISHKNYRWASQNENGTWNLVMRNNNAHDFFINYIEKLRR